jgi:D-tyrosyl-tRNA(Tyr) deacylase
MRIVVQRVLQARVLVGCDVVGEIERGLLLLVGVAPTDAALDLGVAARKVLDLRIFEDGDGKMNRSARETGAAILAVSQFTLFADTRRGRRPCFAEAARPDVAEPLFEAYVAALRAEGANVATGRFGAHMRVESVNDGPVTLILELAGTRSDE